MVSSATPVPEPTAEQSLLSLLSTRPYSDQLTNQTYVDRFRDQAAREARGAALSDAIEAARREYLTDATGTPEDEAYQQAVADVIAAIDALRDATKGGAS